MQASPSKHKRVSSARSLDCCEVPLIKLILYFIVYYSKFVHLPPILGGLYDDLDNGVVINEGKNNTLSKKNFRQKAKTKSQKENAENV